MKIIVESLTYDKPKSSIDIEVWDYSIYLAQGHFIEVMHIV